MKKVLILGIMLLLPLNMLTAPGNAAAQKPCITQSEVKFGNEFRRLWVDHVLWTSNYITSATTAGAEDQKQVLARLLKNQEDIGNSIKPYYGDAAGNKLTELLKEHIVIAGDIIDAAKKGDQKGVDKLNQDWERNANDIVTFLSDANPYWDKEDFTEMFMKHLKLTTDEVIFRLNKDWEEDINTADINEAHLIKMGDMLTDGIVKQFPEKFQ